MQTTRRGFLTTTLAASGLGLARESWGQPRRDNASRPAPQVAARPVPTPEEFEASIREWRNWGRWGEDDQKGAINLITPEKRRSAAGLVRSGVSVSLSRPLRPAQQFVRSDPRPGERGSAIDYLGFIYHGFTATHIDALCHIWGADGGWNGSNPVETITSRGATFGHVEAWKDGIVTRGVLLDVPRHRGTPHVTLESPVHGAELEAIANDEGVMLEPGDAVLVYSGRETWERAGGDLTLTPRPGLHPSCAEFIRDHDVALLGWDMMDATAAEYGADPMHVLLWAYGVALLDNASFEDLSAACAEQGRFEFMFAALPLRVEGGTGSPANPVALL